MSRVRNEGRMTFEIPGNPITKKNHTQIWINRKTGKPFVTQSDAYKQYERDCGWFVPPLGIDYPVNVKYEFYLKGNYKVDLTNLQSSLNDILTKWQCLKDDNVKIVVSHDGSRVYVDKTNPRTVVTITKI